MTRLMDTEILCHELVIVIAMMALTTAAETNAIPQLDRLFILPASQLRTFITDPPTVPPDLQKREVKLSSQPAKMKPARLEAQPSSLFILASGGAEQGFRPY